MSMVPAGQVVITRPVGGAGSLPRRLAELGMLPVHLPGLSLGMADDADGVRHRLAAMTHAHAVIATSPAAVRFASKLAPGLHLPANIRGFGVGATSARALQRLCAGPVQWPARADSEGLLALPALAEVSGRRIVLLAAPGGRGLMADTLRRRGAEVEVLHVYRRRVARWDRRHRQRLSMLRRPLVLITSAEALNAVLSLAGDDRGRLLAGCAVVSSERLEQAARKAGFARVRRASGPGDEALIAACNAGCGTW
jgi:uroporphyrinogen-III synthase